MWNPFKYKPLLSDEDQRFQIECFEWLLTNFGGDAFYKEAQLILPTKEFFPTHVESPESAAETTFNQVKDYAGLSEWPCKLEAQEEDPNAVVHPTIVLQNMEQNPLGTFSANTDNEITITYNPTILSNPTGMVATFAHELSHYLTGTAAEPPPGGWENWEFATDIGAVFLGFGVFLANSAFNFQQYTDNDSQGWSTSGGGYLSEAEYSYSLALFLLLKKISPEEAYPHCDLNIKACLKKAIKELEGSEIVSKLKEVKYVEKNS